MILVYVDDIVVEGNELDSIDRIKQRLYKLFRIKDIGTLKYFLGLEIARSKEGIIFYERKYTLDILHDSGLTDSKHVDLPMEARPHLSETKGELIEDPVMYQRMIGRLIYLTITRPDITYLVHVLSRFMQRPRRPHLDVAFRILHYLKGTPDQGIFFATIGEINLRGYCNSDWASCPDTRRSVTGYYIFLGIHLYHGRLRNNIPSLTHLQKKNT